MGSPTLAMLAAVVGAIIGSYIGVLVLRWPAGEPTVSGRSRCDTCQRQLAWFDLVPLFSFLILRGRCRYCKAVIDPVQAFAEWAGAILCGLAFHLLPIESAAVCALLFLMLLPLALLDARHFWLPDRLVIALALLGLLLGGIPSGGVELTMRLLAAALAFVALESLRRLFRNVRGREGMGAGDPKLFAALALWLSPYDMPLLILIASTLGIALALFTVARRRSMQQMPFGSLLAAAVVVLVLVRL
ncbi:prepilin peptidase [Sphingorhabdus pulchriflava]|uniref:Prepilin leader peptidase/N-methyltransferase n=1 Tax=Sphingorhabdus pulchriflava TaxID=2292257 RepID=A0A371BG52_9SPHN|nr:prepilin peptidase [Sphingorhabdus pulchriflava]